MIYFAQVAVIGLVLGGHEEQQDAVVELHVGQRRRAHEEEDAEKDGHRNVGQNGRHEHRQADHQRDENQSHSLLPAFRRFVVNVENNYFTKLVDCCLFN